jgi:2-polyprenyl-3-methyl-5-hydroxy-6-metoxy-1,4-benzoquinol methylase
MISKYQEIRTEHVECCPGCGDKGNLLQGEVEDPDGNIAGQWDYVVCANRACESVWLRTRPIQQDIGKAYSSYHTHSKSLVGKPLVSLAKRLTRAAFYPGRLLSPHCRVANPRMKYMSCEHDPVGRLLEIGAGGGRYLRRMKERGWHVEGVDIDINLKEKLGKLNIPIHIGDILDLNLTANTYDVIVMSQTIEHVYQPGAVLREVLRLLKPGGKIVLTTPNVASHARALCGRFWRGWEPPRHLHLFSRDTLGRLLHSCGYELDHVSTYSVDSAIGYHASRLQRLRIESGRPAGALDIVASYWWAHRMERKELRLLKRDDDAGQGLYAMARKPAAMADRRAV